MVIAGAQRQVIEIPRSVFMEPVTVPRNGIIAGCNLPYRAAARLTSYQSNFHGSPVRHRSSRGRVAYSNVGTWHLTVAIAREKWRGEDEREKGFSMRARLFGAVGACAGAMLATGAAAAVFIQGFAPAEAETFTVTFPGSQIGEVGEQPNDPSLVDTVCGP